MSVERSSPEGTWCASACMFFAAVVIGVPCTVGLDTPYFRAAVAGASEVLPAGVTAARSDRGDTDSQLLTSPRRPRGDDATFLTGAPQSPFLNGKPTPKDRPSAASRQSCQSDADCDDGAGCTGDSCIDEACVHEPIPDCVRCGTITCPPRDVVFIMDTSGSKLDEAEALCASLPLVVETLALIGITVHPIVLGITETPEGFPCLEDGDDVVTLLGGALPGFPGTCPFPDGPASYESWGPATAIVAARFPWIEGSIRIIVPLSDEGPCNGSLPEGCNDPGDDRESITNAIAVADAYSIVVSPIIGTGADACAITLATDLASGTGGVVAETTDPVADMFNTVSNLLFTLCDTSGACDDGDGCTENDTCVDRACRGTEVPDCEVCTTAAECNDGNVCTVDDCVDGACIHFPTAGPCSDGDPCTMDDMCGTDGECDGTDVNALACSSDNECFGSTCDTQTGLCVCPREPTLCLSVATDGFPDDHCYETGEEIVVNVELGEGSWLVTGGQFLTEYDPSILEFVSVAPGSSVDPNSPFSFEVFVSVDELNGRVFYAGAVPFNHPGTHGPAVMASLRFVAVGVCVTDELCFLNDNPQNTRLIDALGAVVPYIPCCTGPLLITEGPPVLDCPESVAVNADAGKPTALVTWDPPTVTDPCDSAVTMSCTATHSAGLDIDHLIETGGLFPPGRAEFVCTVTDACGALPECSWTVDVSARNTVHLDLQLSPIMADGPLRRYIQFEFYSNCIEAPVIMEQIVDFGPPLNFPGHAKNLTIAPPAGQYMCVTARDLYHSVRSVSDIRSDGTIYMASFSADPFFGGNWLIGGNLNGDDVIDIVDYGIFISQYLRVMDPNTEGWESGPHADINGDGLVDLLDVSFIILNFLATDKNACCPGGRTAVRPEPITEISIVELKAMGLGSLRVADLNDDGLLNEDDITAFLQGGRPGDHAPVPDRRK